MACVVFAACTADIVASVETALFISAVWRAYRLEAASGDTGFLSLTCAAKTAASVVTASFSGTLGDASIFVCTDTVWMTGRLARTHAADIPAAVWAACAAVALRSAPLILLGTGKEGKADESDCQQKRSSFRHDIHTRCCVSCRLLADNAYYQNDARTSIFYFSKSQTWAMPSSLNALSISCGKARQRAASTHARGWRIRWFRVLLRLGGSQMLPNRFKLSNSQLFNDMVWLDIVDFSVVVCVQIAAWSSTSVIAKQRIGVDDSRNKEVT